MGDGERRTHYTDKEVMADWGTVALTFDFTKRQKGDSDKAHKCPIVFDAVEMGNKNNSNSVTGWI